MRQPRLNDTLVLCVDLTSAQPPWYEDGFVTRVCCDGSWADAEKPHERLSTWLTKLDACGFLLDTAIQSTVPGVCIRELLYLHRPRKAKAISRGVPIDGSEAA